MLKIGVFLVCFNQRRFYNENKPYYFMKNNLLKLFCALFSKIVKHRNAQGMYKHK